MSKPRDTGPLRFALARRGAAALSLLMLACAPADSGTPGTGGSGSGGSSPGTGRGGSGAPSTGGSLGAGGSGGQSGAGGSGGSQSGAGGSGQVTPPADAGGTSGKPEVGSAPDAAGGGGDTASSSPPPPGAGPNVDRANPTLHSFSFKPSEADPAARDRDLTQTAMLDTRAPRVQGKLVVVLAGVNGAPGPAGVGRWAASQGFHVLLIAYKNDFNPSTQNDPNFFGAARLEAFDGMDRTPRLTVARADSVEVRIAKAMTLLQGRHAGGDWKYFVDAEGNPRWPEVIFVGHSHGASSAAAYATVRPVHRAISLAGPRDVTPVTATWLTGPSVSPPERFYGFTGAGDSQYADHQKAFGLLKLPGELTDVTQAMPPYGGSHRLRCPGGHGDPAGCDRYAAACKYMFGVQ
jgi:hypothetical protein